MILLYDYFIAKSDTFFLKLSKQLAFLNRFQIRVFTTSLRRKKIKDKSLPKDCCYGQGMDIKILSVLYVANFRCSATFSSQFYSVERARKWPKKYNFYWKTLGFLLKCQSYYNISGRSKSIRDGIFLINGHLNYWKHSL